MKQVLYLTIVFFAALSGQAVAQDAPIFPKGEKAPNVRYPEQLQKMVGK